MIFQWRVCLVICSANENIAVSQMQMGFTVSITCLLWCYTRFW